MEYRDIAIMDGKDNSLNIFYSKFLKELVTSTFYYS